MVQVSIPKSLWGDCVLTCLGVYVIADVTSPHDKFNQRGLKCNFLGYPLEKKDYRVIHLDTKKCYISRDVIFIENVFPFQSLGTPAENVFPASSGCYSDSPLSFDTFSFPVDSSIDVVDHVIVDNSSEVFSEPTLCPSVVPLVRPSRTKVLPPKFKDYTGLPDFISKQFMANISVVPIPYTYKYKVIHKLWDDAMVAEISALEDNNTWDIVPRPPDKNLVHCKWLFKVKYTAEGTVDKYKARLVTKGFT
ncbi:uncharacterized protein LOC141689363 [Apium graveolens]|uniref:uncharacterized protein LOC141689363 n=1 Tax=Apium graveolens TaxID=4045 RepID=UPI003D79544F